MTGNLRAPWRALFVALVAVGCLGACAGDPVGALCSDDSDCGDGLQCFKPDDGSLTPVCTIGCLSTPCDNGVCVQTEYGAVCAVNCEGQGECPGSLVCQAATTGEEVCWYPDANFGVSNSSPVSVTRVEIIDDPSGNAHSNGDGQLNPGESGLLRFYVGNSTNETYQDLWMALKTSPLDFVVTGCRQGAYPSWVDCTADCSCHIVGSWQRTDLAPGEESPWPVLEIAFQLDPAATGTLELELDLFDSEGDSWLQTFSLPIVTHEASVKITSAVVVNDDNGDGTLSPGETGSIDITVANQGTTHIQGLYAELSVADPAVTVLACQASVGGTWTDCDVKCSCAGVAQAAKQALQPLEASQDPVLRLTLQVGSLAAIEPIAFGVRFHDSLGAIWYDSFIVPLFEPEAQLALSRTEVLEDDNGDGSVSPSETASVQIFAKNIGTGKALDVWARLETADPWTTVSSCRVGVGSQWTECDSDCSCENVPASAYQELAPGEHGDIAVLVITFDVNPSAPLNPLEFSVSFHDALGNSWTDDFALTVLPADAEVSIGNAALLDDSNGDGFLSPAESATLEIYPQNDGTSRALAVWADLTWAEPLVELTSCYTASSDEFGLCSSTCSCKDTNITQDIDPESSSSQAILQINFSLSNVAPLQPISFEVTFHDKLGTTWTDTVTVEVVEVKALLQVDSADLWGDSNGDGILTPGETAKIQIKARNVGISQTFGVYASLVNVDEFINVTTCYAQFGDTWTKCDSDCNCQNISEAAKAELASGETSEEVLLRVNFNLSIDAPVEPLTWEVAFHDEFGNTWEDSFVVDVEQYAADVQVGFVEFMSDTNEDGFLSPAESATMVVYPRNDGTVMAMGVWAKLIAVEPGVTVTNCYTEADGSWINCGVGCNCEGVFETALHDLVPETTSDRPILRIDFELASTVSLGSLSFGIAFTDSLGLAWTDMLLVSVVAPDTHVRVGLVEIVSESGGDGVINPGDSATVNVFAENIGTTVALGVWAELTNVSPDITVTSCYAISEEKWATCDVTCSCDSIPQTIKPDIPEGEVSDAVVLQISFNVSPTALPGPQTFVLGLTDVFDNAWEDTFSIEVLP